MNRNRNGIGVYRLQDGKVEMTMEEDDRIIATTTLSQTALSELIEALREYQHTGENQ